MESSALQYVRGKISKEEYLSSSLAELDLSEQCEGIDGCEDFIKRKLSDSFWELDKLDRADAFWNQTNKLPTFHKLRDFAQHQINNNCNLESAAWLKIISDLVIVSQHLETEPWKILKDNDALNISFLVRTAWNVSSYWSELNIKTFSNLISELHLENEIENELEEIAKISDESKQWVKDVKAELKLV